MDALVLENAVLRLTVAPQGATVLGLESVIHQQPVLRCWQHNTPWHPGDSALFPMLPLANRVADNQFRWQGATISLPQSPVDDRFFLHGDGWLQNWQVAAQDAQQIILTTTSRHDCGFDYAAQLTYRLAQNHFIARLELVHQGKQPMVYGLGFHPFFHLTPGDRVQFSASGYWPEGDQHLPLAWSDTFMPGMDFMLPTEPANAWLNQGYSGWNGCALIERQAMTVRLTSSAGYLMVFREADQPFICLEPQSHPVNAHNMPGMPGLVTLQKGESIHTQMVIDIT